MIFYCRLKRGYYTLTFAYDDLSKAADFIKECILHQFIDTDVDDEDEYLKIWIEPVIITNNGVCNAKDNTSN